MNESSKIWIAVTCIHLVGLAFISTSSESKPSPKRLLVVTKHVVIPPPQVITHTPLTQTVITPNVKQEKSTPLKKPPLKKNPLPTKKAPKSSKQVLKKIEKRLTKTHTPIPPKPPLQEPVQPQEPFLPTYVDTACFVFRDLLILPEKGGVKLTITVQANGKIDKVEVETFESKKNLDYLMTMLPTLSLPAPEGGKDATFTVLFCNDTTDSSK